MPDDHARRLHQCEFRFYGPLNDFLAPSLRQSVQDYHFSGAPSLRDAIQAQGVPHTEVSWVQVGGEPRPPEYRLYPDAQVSVYPRALQLPPAADQRWDRPWPIPARFILDVHLGKLARHLRLLGFDSLWGRNLEDDDIIACAAAENRIIFTRDLGILKQVRVAHGYFVRATNPNQQIDEVLTALGLRHSCQPLTRCINCNGELQQVTKAAVTDVIPPGTRHSYQRFYRCSTCLQVYWRGAHYLGLMGKLRQTGAPRPVA